ncbi:MAG TPA: hypothetical protein PKJ83_16805 [Cyclobacteriaceae bacterium]|nr:hypothetical protein [Cyclobacteriaceae bacterium]
MMTIDIKKRMYRNIALLIFLLLTSIVAAFSKEVDAVLRNQKAPIGIEQPSQSVNMINL